MFRDYPREVLEQVCLRETPGIRHTLGQFQQQIPTMVLLALDRQVGNSGVQTTNELINIYST